MTLVEVLVAVAIAVVAAAAFLSLSQGARAFSRRAAVQRVDAALAFAQALAASSGNGATLVFSPRKTNGGALLDGFVLTVYEGRPSSANALHAAPLAPVIADSGIAESKLGAPPFCVFLDAANHASAARGAVAPGAVLPNDPGCPTGEKSVTLVFGDPRASVTRSIACNAVP